MSVKKWSKLAIGYLILISFTLIFSSCIGFNKGSENTSEQSLISKLGPTSLRLSKLEISLCSDDECGEKNIGFYFENNNALATSDLEDGEPVIVNIESDLIERVWKSLGGVHFTELVVHRAAAQEHERSNPRAPAQEPPQIQAQSKVSAEEIEGVPGCKASYHVRIQNQQSTWYSNICRGQQDVSGVLSRAIRDVDYLVLKNRIKSSGKN